MLISNSEEKFGLVIERSEVFSCFWTEKFARIVLTKLVVGDESSSNMKLTINSEHFTNTLTMFLKRSTNQALGKNHKENKMMNSGASRHISIAYYRNKKTIQNISYVISSCYVTIMLCYIFFPVWSKYRYKIKSYAFFVTTIIENWIFN